MINLFQILPKWSQGALNLLEVLLVICALLVTTSSSVKQAILVYQWQCLLLAVVVTITAIGKTPEMSLSGGQSGLEAVFLILLIALLPGLLLVIIRPLLHRATLATPSLSTADDLKMILVAIIRPLLELTYRLRSLYPSRSDTTPHAQSGFSRRIEERLVRYRALERDAEIEWQSRQTMQKGLGTLLLFPVLLLVAILVPFSIPQTASFEQSERVGLTVSLVLHLIGLYNMIVKQDIISQVIGLLIMDQGLYLAVVKIVEIPVPATLFVISLYFYTLITVFILVILLPKIREKTESIDLAEIARKSDLKSK